MARGKVLLRTSPRVDAVGGSCLVGSIRMDRCAAVAFAERVHLGVGGGD